MPTGVVARFDPRHGWGFVVPDDGGPDVFVHQNNINMEGFRYLKPGEHVSYELEVGEKGLRAIQVNLLDERPAGDSPFRGEQQQQQQQRPSRQRGNAGSGSGSNGRARVERGGAAGGADVERLRLQLDKLGRKQERLISLLVAKGVLAPGEIDGLSGDDGYGAYDDDDDDDIDDEEDEEEVAGARRHDEA